MGIGEIIAIAIAGTAAGTINTVVGSGTLITFPGAAGVRLRAGDGERVEHDRAGARLGLRARSATGASSPGSAERRCELGSMSVLGGVTGAVLLLVLPASAFKDVVPAFIAVALVLTVLAAAPERARWRATWPRGRAGRSCSLPLAVYITGVYGGYFGAGQGILLLAIFGGDAAAEPASLQRAEERAGGHRQRRRRRVFHLRRARRVGARGDHRRHLDRSARRSARATAGACIPTRCAR